MKKLIINIILLIFSINSSAEENSEDLSKLKNLLNTKINGASRFEQNLYEINGFANFVDYKNIQQFGFRSTADVLQSFAGNYTSYERDYRYLGVKGIARPGDFNSRILLMSDGVRLNDPLYDAGLIGYESPIDIDWIKKIEFVSSPGSAQFGANAILGVANLVNFTGSDIQGTKIKYTRESFQGNKITLLHGNSYNGSDDFLFGITAYHNPGGSFYMPQYDQPKNNDGVANHADSEEYVRGFIKFSYDNWLFNAVISSREKVLPTAYWNTKFNSSGTSNTDKTYFLNLTRQTNLAENIKEKIRFRAGGYQYQGKFDGDYQDNKSESTWYGADYELKIFYKSHQIALGIDTQYNQKLRQRQFYADQIKDLSNDFFNYSVFAEDHWKINESNSLQSGIRVDRINSRTAVSPKLALNHRLNETATIKYSYSRAFRAPNSYEQLNTRENLAGHNFNARSLNNEYITSNEIILQTVTSSEHLLSLNVFHRTIHDIIYQHYDQHADYVFTNGKHTITDGFSIESNYLSDNLSLRSNLTLQESNLNGDEITHSPRLLAKVLASKYLPALNLDVSLNMQFNSKSEYGPDKYTSGYTISNLIFSLRETQSLGKGSFAIYNLFDKKYSTPTSEAIRDSHLIQDGRQFRFYWEYPF